MIVLSLFDGISCGKVALERAGIKIHKYYSSEIDKHAIKVSEYNHPNIIRMGDISHWKKWNIKWSEIDLVIAGSPCQGFSFAGKQLAFEDPRSQLFFSFYEILKTIKRKNKNVKFLLENVRMKKSFLNIITEHLNEEPFLINSSLFSAQNRERYYWFNWNPQDIKNKNIFLDNIIEKHLNKENSQLRIESDYFKCRVDLKNETLKKQNFFCGRVVGRRLDENGIRKDYDKSIPIQQMFEPRMDSKTGTLTTVKKDNILCYKIENHLFYRNFSPVECERLQTLPDNYTQVISENQRYKCLGNGWTVDVISHILKSL